MLRGGGQQWGWGSAIALTLGGVGDSPPKAAQQMGGLSRMCPEESLSILRKLQRHGQMTKILFWFGFCFFFFNLDSL